MSKPNALKNLAPKPRHSLSSIDKESLTAICAVCGPTDVHQVTIKKKYTAYICATKSRQSSRAYRLTHPHVPQPQQFKPTAHVLSNVDDQNKTATCSKCGPVKIYIRHYKNLVTRVCKNAASERSERAKKKREAENRNFTEGYKLELGCRKCGYREDAKTLQFHAPGRDRRADHIGKLMRLTQQSLVMELEKYEVLCKNCHNQVHARPSSKPRRKHKPLPFGLHTN